MLRGEYTQPHAQLFVAVRSRPIALAGAVDAQQSADTSFAHRKTCDEKPCVALPAQTDFFKHRLQGDLVETEVRHQRLQPSVLLVQFFQSLQLAHIQPGVIRLPSVDACCRYAILPVQLADIPTRF